MDEGGISKEPPREKPIHVTQGMINYLALDLSMVSIQPSLYTTIFH